MIQKTVLLFCRPERAFSLFTEQISEWWPPSRRHAGDPNSLIVLSQQRFYERTTSGTELELGRVVTWDPPRRIVLDFFIGTDADHPTAVEISFRPEEEGTRVTIDHRFTPASEQLWKQRAPRYVASWELVLAALEKAASALR